MSQRFPGGIVSSNPPAPSSSSASGIWTLKQALEYIQAGTWPGLGDPDFEYVTMLLPGNGTNGAQNNTFLDSSTNNFTITRNGNTTQGTFSPYGDNWSNYFDGNGDYLSIAAGSAANLSSGDFTIELWFYATVGGVNASLIQQGEHDWRLDANASNQLQWVTQNANRVTTAAFSLNTWNHVAISKSGSTQTVYLNGVSQGTTTSNPANSTSAVAIGINTAGIGNVWPFTGYISNARVVKGTAVYTGNFTPSTAPLTAITNTSLLTCQSNRFRDVSSNNFAITVNGNTSVQRFSPFAPTVAYSAATIGGSGYFDGNGDYLTLPDSTALDLPGDFALEFWGYVVSGTGFEISLGSELSGRNGFNFYLASDFLGIYSNQTDVIKTTGVPTLGRWTHVALTRSGTTLRIFANGTQVGSATNSTSFTGEAANGLSIHAAYLNAIRINTSTVYYSNFRLVKGNAVYTSAFTPPTSPVTAITNTSLLLNFTNAGIIDNAMMNDLETVGNAQINTSVTKFGSGSLRFDGSGDGLAIPNTQNIQFNTGAFTIEAWVYIAGNSALNDGGGRSAVIISCLQSNSTSWSFGIAGSGSTTGTGLYFESRVGGSTQAVSATGTLAQSQWHHVAVVRSGTTTTLYLNGSSIGSGTLTNQNLVSSNPISIGRQNFNGFFGELNGYIDDLRVTRGVARYTANFTPPSAPFPIN